MKRRGILNRELVSLIASLGHTDVICIADAGLPIPSGVARIDLALRCGIPSFLDTARAILEEVIVEHAFVASEMSVRNPACYEALRGMLGQVPLEQVPHEQFKAMLPRVRGVVRTGECTPYANVLLRSGVSF